MDSEADWKPAEFSGSKGCNQWHKVTEKRSPAPEEWQPYSSGRLRANWVDRELSLCSLQQRRAVVPWESRESIARKSGIEIILLYPVLVKQIWIAEPVVEHLLYEERLVAETRYPGEDSGGSYPSMYILERGRRAKMKKDEIQILLSGIQWKDKKWAQIQVRKIPFKHKKLLKTLCWLKWSKTGSGCPDRL